MRVRLEMSRRANDRLANTKAPLFLHSCTSVIFTIAWLTCLESFQRSSTGIQIALIGSLIGLLFLWHSRLIGWITEPVANAESLSEQIRGTLNAMPEGLMVTDKRNRIMMANETLLSSIGLTSDEVIGKRPESLPWVTSSAARARDLPWVQSGRQPESKQEQLMRYQVPDGSERFFSVNATPVIGDQNVQEGAVVTIRDVTQMEAHRTELEQMLMKLRFSRDEVQSQNRELQVLANQDSLTGCFNRRAFFDTFRSNFTRSIEEGLSISCVMIDVDHFKQVNDHYGHQVGDEVLKSVSMVLREDFASPCCVGRYGGEEFCVMMPNAGLTEATDLAEMVRQRIESIQFIKEPTLRLSASLGVSSLRHGVDSLEDLIRQADECLYHAKRNGRNLVVNRDSFVALVEGPS